MKKVVAAVIQMDSQNQVEENLSDRGGGQKRGETGGLAGDGKLYWG